MITTTDQGPAAVDGDRLPPPPGPVKSAFAFLRNTWRGLTSMRTALILLFLLALASLPGALLPQWALNTDKTSAYIAAHPFWGPLLNKLEFFDVFGSVWYSAIYILLFISLIGCLVPRTLDFARHLRDKPVATPRNLARMPLSTVYQVDTAGGATAEKVEAALRSKHWRVAARTESAGVQTISAEKGYLREIGNLVFHFSLVGLLIAVAVGELFGFDGSVIKDVDGQPFCSSSPAAYDNFRPGLTVDGTDMAPFCVRLNTFQAGYAPSGQAVSFSSGVQYQAGAEAGSDTWHSATLQVNDPLRMDGERLYLLGQGYAPTVRITFPNGAVRDETADFISSDSSLLSTGAIKVPDPPGIAADQLTKHQLAIAGLFAPTAVVNGGIMTSVFPAADKPGLAIRIYRGDLGMEGGVPQSVYAIDQGQVDAGKLVLQKQVNLFVGQSVSLSDGTKITFTGYNHWLALQTSYDPAQFYALIFAITLLCGLMLSLTIKRRRLWFRFVPAASAAGADEAEPTSSRTVVHVGGLARTDQAGYGSEFDAVSRLADGDEPAEGRS